MDARADIRNLIDAARGGRPEALGRIFEAARSHLLQVADRELPADLRAKVGPSDVVQQTAVEMHRDFGRFTGTTAEECFAWLREILRHNVVDAVRYYREAAKRDAKREVTLADGITPDGGPFVAAAHTPDGSAIRREEAAALHDVIVRLPAEYQRVLQLRYWHGMSFTDIAPMLGRSPDAVRKLWYRALDKLQQELAALPTATIAAESLPTDVPTGG